MITGVMKRNGELIAYDRSKIIKAVEKANAEVDYTEQATDKDLDKIIATIEERYSSIGIVSVEDIQNVVETTLMQVGRYALARKYILYRETRKAVRNSTLDNSILSLVNRDNKEVMEENSNKNANIAPTQRDLIAGEVSKDITKRVLLPEKISKAHDDGVLHFHDADYFIQPIFNCCLIDIKDMFNNGTVINGKLIETPKSFQVACTVMTQIISNISSGQYGGQSVNIKHLAPYIAVSREKIRNKRMEDGLEGEMLDRVVEHILRDELASGVQTITYQLNTLMTTNGQSPFVTLFLELDLDYGYVEEQVMLIKEIFKQRIDGIKNEKGVDVTPPFPKLIYVLDEHNCLKGGEYDWLTKLAVKCSSTRMYPDYISAKKMRENYDGQVFSCMGCRSFLSAWKDENGHYKWEGRFNQGVVSLNLPQIAIVSQGNFNKFWELMEERLALCFEALMLRHKSLLGTPSDVSPIHWQHGGIARLKKGEKIDKLLKDGYSTISLGYIGVYEMTKIMTGESHTGKNGKEFALKVMNYLRETCERWKKITGLGFGLYGTPAESLCYRFARIDAERFGEIEDITDKGYYTNSYHIDVREKIDAFSKLGFESEFQQISSGGAISYIEVPNMRHNLEALEEVVKFIYDNIQYAEFNTKSDYCMECNFDGEIIINEDNEWECPCCHNKNKDTLNVTRRTCGYLGQNFWNVGKTKEIKQRLMHL